MHFLFREKLSHIYDTVANVEELDSGDTRNLAALQRPELGVTFTKIYAWSLTDYDKYAVSLLCLHLLP